MLGGWCVSIFFLMIRRPPRSTLFPYTTALPIFSWLCREHPDSVRCDYAVNEGGGDRLELAGGAIFQATTAEKMSAPFLLRVRGRSGHASMPGIADNALVKAARLIERIAAFRPEPQLGPEV